jgi:hypothetical protein
VSGNQRKRQRKIDGKTPLPKVYMDYLLTWNCKHIANIAMRGVIEKTCRAAGYEPPAIGTPEEFGD